MSDMTITDVNALIATGELDLNVLSTVLDDLKRHSFTELYALQKNGTGITQVRLKYSDFKDVVPDNVFAMNEYYSYKAYNIPHSFIVPEKRVVFKRSKFYNVPLNNTVINANRNIFVHNFLVFVNGYLDTSAKLICKEEISTLALNKGYMETAVANTVTADSTIDVLFIPEMTVTSTTTTKTTLQTNSYVIPSPATFSTNQRLIVMAYRTGSLRRCYRATYNATTKKITLPNAIVTPFNSADTINLDIIAIGNYVETEALATTDSYFSFTEKAMPVPKENFIGFDTRTDGSIAFHCGLNIENKYPATIKVNDVRTLPMTFDMFYWSGTENSELKYLDETSVYGTYVKVLPKYKDGSISTVLSTYNPFDYIYSILDFYNGSFKGVTDGPTLYKVDKFKGVIKSWAYALKYYTEKMRESQGGYIVPMTNVDLTSKLRKDNKTEILEPSLQKTFSEDRYVYIFKNSSTNTDLPYKFWIDGLRYYPDEVYLDGTYEYVYIPKSRISQYSTIEIEPSRNTVTSSTVTVGTDAVNLTFASDDTVVPMKSVFLTTPAGKYVDMSQYKITALINGIRTEIQPNSLMNVSNSSKLQATPRTADASNVTLTMRVNDTPIEFTRTVDYSNYMVKNLNADGAIHGVKPDKSRIRVFRNNKLLPLEDYVINFPDNITDPVDIELNLDNQFGDYIVDYIPEGYNTVAEIESISSDGIINLDGKIDKPFSTKYYDLYVNGVRVLPSQIKQLSNFSIAVSGMETLRNVYVYEKDSPTSSFKFDSASNLASDVLMNDDSFKNAVTAALKGNNFDNPSIPDVDSVYASLTQSMLGLIDIQLNKDVLYSGTEVPLDEAKAFDWLFGHTGTFLLDASKTYTESGSEDGVPSNNLFFMSPQTKYENMGIHSLLYITQLETMYTNMLSGKFLDANASDKPSIETDYPLVNLHDGNGFRLIDTKNIRRNVTGVVLLKP